jgi:hypothetical protein
VNWIHTAVVVMSKDVNPTRVVIGGHSLNARVSRFEYDETLPVGKTEVRPDRTILINPKDLGRINNIVREAGINFEKLEDIQPRLEGMMANSGNIPPRPPSVALGLSGNSSPPPPNSGFHLLSSANNNELSNIGVISGWGSFRSENKISSNDLSRFREDNQQSAGMISVIKENDFFLIITDEKNAPTKAYSIEALSDSIVNLLRQENMNEGQELKMTLHGFELQEAAALIRTSEVRAAGEKIPREIDAYIKSENLTADSLIAPKKTAGYDFMKASYNVSEFETSARGFPQSTIEISIPPLEANGAVAKTKATIEYGKTTPRGIISRFLRRVKKSVDDLIDKTKGRMELMNFKRDFKREIKRVSNESGVDVKSILIEINEEKGDAYFGQNNETNNDFIGKYFRIRYPA